MYLKLYDENIAHFYINESPEANVFNRVVIDSHFKVKTNLLPAGVRDSADLIDWLQHRSVTRNRKFMMEIAKSITNKKVVQFYDLLKVSKGLSLNDAYWVVEDDFRGTFDDYNLYENRFSKRISDIAYIGFSDSIDQLKSTPELTTNGTLRKCWRRIDSEIYLYKGGYIGEDKSKEGIEPYSEFYAYQVAECMGLLAVPYDLRKFHKSVSSVCKLFTSKSIGYVPVHAVLQKLSKRLLFLNVVDLYKSFGYYDFFASMMVFDAIVANTDRHAGNFGFFVDNKSQRVLSPAPIFDNGMSLFNATFDKNLPYYKDIFLMLQTPFQMRFDDLCMFMGNTQKKQVERLINFKFRRHKYYNLPAKRLRLLDEFIQWRVKTLLSL